MTAAAVDLQEAVRDAIRSEMEIAKAKYGPDHFEILCIEGCWADQLVDERQTLLHLRTLNRTGSLYITIACEV